MLDKYLRGLHWFFRLFVILIPFLIVWVSVIYFLPKVAPTAQISDLLHEHNDNRIHVEGVVKDYKDITLGEFFRVTGGELTNNTLTVVTNDPPGMVKTYQECNGKEGDLQVFVYKNEIQTKVENPVDYVLSPESQIPPGDCIIIEFDSQKERTDRICQSLKYAK